MIPRGALSRRVLSAEDRRLLAGEPEPEIVETQDEAGARRLYEMTRTSMECPSDREAVLEWDADHPGDGCPLCGGPPALHREPPDPTKYAHLARPPVTLIVIDETHEWPADPLAGEEVPR